jgi:hypothetical protein
MAHMKNRRRFFFLTVFTLAALVFSAAPTINSVRAQSNSITWSAPINLSNTPESSSRPAIVTDQFGYVHVFWSEEVGGRSIYGIPKALIHDGNTIMYTRWDGKTWTQPIDILFVPGDDVATYVAATVDGDGWLHILWSGQSDIYYSKAPAWQADSAHNWTAPVAVASGNARTQWESDIIASKDGTLHAIYATGGGDPGIYHIQSVDHGETWGPPTRISGPLDILEENVSNARICIDGVGRLHVTWQTNQEEGYGQSAYYARSIDGGATWSAPYQLGYRRPGDYGVVFPSIACVGDSEIHIINVGGAWHYGRYEHISTDGGATWSEPYHILTDLEGVNGYTYLLVDGAGQKHLVTTMRTSAEQQGGTFYARWMNNAWSPESLAVPEADDTGPGAHWTATAVRLGNEIHILWNTNFTDKAGEIWHTRGIIPGVPQQAAVPVPNTNPAVPDSATPKPDVTAAPIPVDVNRVPPVNVANTFAVAPSPVATLLIIVAPVLLLLIAVVLFRALLHAR